jgi:N-acetylmuramoyl-L-alanine amidase
LKDQLHTKKSVPVPEVQEFLEPWEQEKKPEPKVEPKVTRKPAPPRNSSPSKSAGKPTRTRVPWKVKEYRNSKYVPLSQVKDFYGFTSMTKSGGYIILRNSEVELKFRAGGQEVLMNNVKFIFSHAVVSLGTYHISIVDLSKVIDPVLRPFEIKEAKEFDTVIIDPGHGGKDAGAVNSLGTEAGYNLKVAKLLQENLKKRGFKVIMTRTTNVFLTLQERVELANRHKDAIFISIHFNSAGSGDSSQDRGIETFTLSPVGVAHYGRGLKASDNIERMGNAQDSANTALATAIHWRSIQALAKAKLEVPDRGIRRARYSVLTGVKHPAIHFVGGFMSHPKEKYLINNPTYQRTLAESMCEAIVFYRKATMQKIGPAKR